MRALVSWIACGLLAGCASTTGDDTARHRELGATEWQLVEIQSMDGGVTRPEERSKYTLAFAEDGRLAVRIDCNRGTGTWDAREGQLQIGPLAMTRAMCPPGSLHDRMLRDLGLVRSYATEDGRLQLSTASDGGTYVFEPQPGL
jgi:para-nitrobenzyl esterase